MFRFVLSITTDGTPIVCLVMKTKCRLLFAFLYLALCLPGSPARAGTEILFYPFARLFGGQSESELVRCRVAFQQMQTNFAISHLVVMPVLVADSGTVAENCQWHCDLAAAVVRDISARTSAKVEISATEPKVAMPKPFHNQLRYLTKRSAAYGAWVKATHPPGDYVFVAEIFGGKEIIYAIQIYVFNSSGQLAYSRLLNSHQFGNNLTLSGDAPVEKVADTFLKDLKRDVQNIFPPYGVG